MYTSLNQVVKDLQGEAVLTQKVLDVLTDASLAAPSVAEGYWTVGKLAWHLVTAHGAMLAEAGLQFQVPPHDAPVPASAKELADAYRATSEAALTAIQNQWNDATLGERRTMWGMMDLSVPGVITSFVRHQAHHRGQLTVLMRAAGVKAPGVYGPSQEEWAAMSAGQQ